MRYRYRLLAGAAALAMAGAIAAAAPAMAAGPGNGTIPSTLTVTTSITLSQSATSYAFSGASGTLPGGSNQDMISTNDAAGYTFSVAASALSGPGGSVAASTQSDHVQGGWAGSDGLSNHAADEATCSETAVVDSAYPMTGSAVIIGTDTHPTNGDCWAEAVSLALPGATQPGAYTGHWDYVAAAN